MVLSRREFLGLGAGAASAAVVAGLGLFPARADAIMGIDDALLGAVVVAVAALGGYAFYTQYSGNLALEAVGAGFGNYISSSNNRVAAAAAAAQIAATYGISSTQQRFETAAQNIADGTGAFADAMADAAATGRLALDGLVTGADDMVGAFRQLVSGYFSSDAVGRYPQAVPGVTTVGPNNVVLNRQLSLMDFQAMRIFCDAPAAPFNNVAWGVMRLKDTWEVVNNDDKGYFYCGSGACTDVYVGSSGSVQFYFSGSVRRVTIKRNSRGLYTTSSWTTPSQSNLSLFPEDIGYVTGDIVSGPILPGVDVPADVPGVIGAGWDSMPIASDMVINPTTGDVVSAGSIALPSSVPATAGDYAAALQDALAGVIAGQIALPVSISQPVVVATTEGVATMPISEAIATETSLQLEVVPDIPIAPVLPPTDVPTGPWDPVIDLPFHELWPFNMIYSMVELFGDLGGS